MAATLAGIRLTERHRSEQVALKAVFLQHVLQLWPLLDPIRLDATAGAWLSLMMDLIVGFRTQSIGLSLTYYDAFRTAETGAAALDREAFLKLMEPANVDQIRTSLVVTGPARILHRTRQGMDPQQADRKALVDVSGAASRHVLNGGRDMQTTAVARDKTALGWARVTGLNPCSFCAVLASRGPKYKSRATAELTTMRSRRGAGQPYHDHCACTAEPVFTRKADWPGRAKEFEQLWIDSTKGYSGKDALNAFRRAYDALPVADVPTQRIGQ
jgi:hypothetical protein